MKNLERKMSILRWDDIPKANDEMMYDDVASDTSSDLFEIDNLSISGSFRYSDYDEKRTVYTTSTRQTTVENKSGVVKKAQKSGVVGLLGCKSHQSVKVAEPVYRTANQSKH